MSDLADNIDPTAPLERVAEMHDPIERTGSALTVATNALRLAAWLMMKCGKEIVLIPAAELEAIPVDALHFGKPQDGMISVLLDV